MEYGHGGDIYGDYSIKLDFSVNTNPFGIPDSVRRAVSGHEEDWSRYPDSQCRELRTALAKFYNSKASCQKLFCKEDFICGNGASDLLYSLVFSLRPRRAAIVCPSFGEYERALKAADCKILEIELKENEQFSVTAALIKDWLSLCNPKERPDLMILGNPNNPTGRAVSGAEMGEIADICREQGIFLIIDECFSWFLEEPDKYQLTPFLEPDSRIFLLNAFTKIYAMAGLRLGYGICRNRAVMEQVLRCRQPWSVSGPAMRAGLAALQEQEFVRITRDTVKRERNFLEIQLKELGFRVYQSEANYILFSSNNYWDYKGFCAEKGILIRSCENFSGLGQNYFRTAVRLHEENAALIQCLAQAEKKRRSEEDKLWQKQS